MKRSLVAFCCLALGVLKLQAALLVDDSENGLKTNNLGSAWTWHGDRYSSVEFTPDEKPGYAGSLRCRKLAWHIQPGAPKPFVYAETQLKADRASVKLGAYCGVRFYARGAGAYRISLPIDATRSGSNHYGAEILLTPQWTLYEIPFFALRQTTGPSAWWNPDTVYAVRFQALGPAGASGVLYVDNIEFFSKTEIMNKSISNPIVPSPKLNQVGYLPGADKRFSITTGSASAGDPFSIVNAATGKVVSSGAITGPPLDNTAEAGEFVFREDFSTLRTPGTYYVSVNGLTSHQFIIADDVYSTLFRDALRCFSLIRCGTAVDDEETGVKHPACHTKIYRSDAPSRTLPASGGWHNAGDFGKWTIQAALSAAYMMWLYQVKTKQMRGLKIDIRESAAWVSDLLAEARWGLEWLLKMQRPDGSVYHKIDTEPDFCFGTPPDKDPLTSRVSFQSRTRPQTPSTVDAGDFTAVMAQAYRVFRKIDPAFADLCRKAALRSWKWIASHPAVGQTDPYYTDPDPSQEVTWATAEMFALTGDAVLQKQLKTEINAEPFVPPSWMAPQALGYFSLLFNPKTDAALKTLIETKLTDYCDSLALAAGRNGYGVVTTAAGYYWESNEVLLHKAACLVFCSLVTEKNEYAKLALNQLDYLLGANSLDQSFITGYGWRRNTRPYHWTMAAYGIMMPGWASGGPNGYEAGADPLLAAMVNCGLPPAKCWLDLCGPTGSWASNEGETSENAALVFLSGFFATYRFTSSLP